jgi:hypothetical protein
VVDAQIKNKTDTKSAIKASKWWKKFKKKS